VKKDAAFQRRWLEGAKALSQLYVSLTHAPFARYEREFLGLQRKLLATLARTEWEQKEIRRRVAEEILLGAWSMNSPWADFGRALRRVQRLGYSNVERRAHVALLFARWARLNTEHLSRARRMLDVAEAHLLVLSPKDTQYKDVRRGLELIRQEVEFAPHSRVTARSTHSLR
jgi:hypothetical protein